MKVTSCVQIVSIALTAALILGCQPFQNLSTGVQDALFGPPQPIPMGDAVLAPPLQNNTLAQPQFVAQGNAVGNPLFVPVSNQDWAWEQIVDVVDDYFRIERENRVQLVGNVLTEGRIDSFPQIGATWLEPHRPDSIDWESRWESTFRRRAVLRVVPEQTGYLVDIAVYKDLEDLPRPERSTAGATTFRNDDSLRSRLGEDVNRTRLAQNWIPLGRDPLLEQQILGEIHARLAQ